MEIADFDSFRDSLNIPTLCELNKPLFKKTFQDSGMLDAADKKCLKDDVEKIKWLYTLKPSTINIAPYADKEREYPEVAILHVVLSNSSKVKRIASFINRSIPYPLILLFTCEIEGQMSLAVSLADKRTNQVDKEKWVIGDQFITQWMSLLNQSTVKKKFLHSLAINKLSFTNFYVFYKSFIDRVIALNCAEHSGEFTLGVGDNIDRLAILKEMETLTSKKSEIASRLKKEKQMGRQVELNTQIKQINDKIAEIKSNL